MKKTELILSIDTASQSEIILMLKSGGKTLAKKKFLAPKKQAEKLLPAIEKMLVKNWFQLKELSGIEVVNRGGTFTSLRIGVITANALAFSLGVPVVAIDKDGVIVPEDIKKAQGLTIVAPHYDAEPNIGKKK
ncbi:MAG: tRNA (adenosine(37)-N6)-threonylcarbamoyltransferase complex dimerization subunit type 1 TsaB [Candidatus Falkowbacteria bacterium]|nr:tRNA (adenosine(37)-N6)-threonylcarbamoyltransferase complex dimerization subunit type 1 TsaB [Candidatus Falkowbacteria bacterium]